MSCFSFFSLRVYIILLLSSSILPSLSVIISESSSSSSKELPYIVGTVNNVTAPEGKSAVLTCVVKNIKKYHVVWFHVERNMLLTIHTKIVTRINRFRVTEDDGEKWSLHIRDVTPEDKGAYACQVNTEPLLREVGYLDVVVSPDIYDSMSTQSTVVVKENDNVTLMCHAVGNPQPNVTWVRDDGRAIQSDHGNKKFRHRGVTLDLVSVKRTDSGAFLCIASNGYPPSVSKRTELYVEFAPLVTVPNQLMAAPVDTKVTLECVTEAYPRAVIYWSFMGNMLMTTPKYSIKEKREKYHTHVYLTIKKLSKGDFGFYVCTARNSFGENTGEVELSELALPISKEEEKQEAREKFNSVDEKQDEVLFEATESGTKIKPKNRLVNSSTKNTTKTDDRIKNSISGGYYPIPTTSIVNGFLPGFSNNGAENETLSKILLVLNLYFIEFTFFC